MVQNVKTRLQRSETVRFGSLGLSATTVMWKDQSIPVSEITKAELLRTNLTDKDPAVLWQYYVQLVAVDIDQTWRLSRIKGWRVWGNARKQGAAEWQGCRAGGFEFGDCRRVGGDEFVEGP